MKVQTLTIAFFLLTCASAWGQDDVRYHKFVAEGNRYFHEQQYHLAIQYYRDAISLDINDAAVDYRLAESYRNTFNYTEAEAYYLKVLYTGQSAFPLSLYYYALMMKLNGNISEAIERFDQFTTLHEGKKEFNSFVEQAIIEKAGCEIAQQELNS